MNPDLNVPPQEEGASSETLSTKQVSQSEAFEGFEIAKTRLKTIHKWKDYAGTGSAEFILTDKKGKPVEREPEKGDHFRINIPGPGNESGEGYDWVRIEDIIEGNEKERFFSMKVRPAPAPVNDKNDTAHFFSEKATSTFTVSLKDNTLSASVIGRNEKPNTEVEKETTRLRNAAVATGAVTLFSKIQWKKLVNGILDF